MAFALYVKVLEGLQLVVRYPMPFQTLSFGYRTPFFKKQGTFMSQFGKMNKTHNIMSTCLVPVNTRNFVVFFIFPNFVGPKSTTKVLCMGIFKAFGLTIRFKSA